MKLLPLLIFTAFAPFLSCTKAPETPEAIAEECFAALAAGDYDKAADYLYRGDSQLKWVKTYYGKQPVEKLFSATFDKTVTLENVTVVVYTAEKTLFNSFGKQDLLFFKQEDGKWKIDLEESSRFRNRINGGGLKTNLSMVGNFLGEATKKLGRPPSSIEELAEQQDLPSKKKTVINYTRMYDYHPNGKTICGVSGVIFYSKEPLRDGMFIGATKTQLFLTDGTESFVELPLSLM